MTVRELSERLGFAAAAGDGGADKEVRGCYIGDLMSLAMSKLSQGNVWLTIQSNINIVAISVLCENSCIILCDGQRPDAEAVDRANSEDIPLLISEKSTYETALMLAQIGV